MRRSSYHEGIHLIGGGAVARWFLLGGRCDNLDILAGYVDRVVVSVGLFGGVLLARGVLRLCRVLGGQGMLFWALVRLSIFVVFLLGLATVGVVVAVGFLLLLFSSLAPPSSLLSSRWVRPLPFSARARYS